MKPKSTLSAIGGWNSFFFCVGMYLVALFFSIFVCSSIFYIANSNSKSADKDAYVAKSAKTALAVVNK